jgi:hypothetical protein
MPVVLRSRVLPNKKIPRFGETKFTVFLTGSNQTFIGNLKFFRDEDLISAKALVTFNKASRIICVETYLMDSRRGFWPSTLNQTINRRDIP